MTKTLKDYILNDMGFSATDKSIIKSLLEHNADSILPDGETLVLARGDIEKIIKYMEE